MKKIYGILFLLVFLPCAKLSAQVIPTEEPEEDEVRYSLVPFAGYTSDLGLIGGLLLQRFNYGAESDQPFLSHTAVDATVTTRGNLIGKFDYDRTRSFGTDIRSRFTFIGERNRQRNYFGIGNQTEYSSDDYDEGFFFYENRELTMRYRGRKQMWNFGDQGTVDLLLPVSFTFLDASSRGEVTRFDEDQPAGTGSAWVNKLGIGVIADGRDSEFAPTKGFRYEATVYTSPSFMGSDYTFSEIRADLRHYLQIFKDVVIAQNIQAEHRPGTVPFWELSTVGSEKGLRGYHEDRFRGTSSILHMLELRTWIFSLFEGEMKIGGQLFWDTGRVYSDNDSGRFFDNWKHSYGAGGALSVLDSNVILRGDIGFSEESTLIYLGVGYVF